MTTITITIDGEAALLATDAMDDELKGVHTRPTKADYAHWAAHSRATYPSASATRAAVPLPLAAVATVSVPSTTEVYYQNGERKTYCVTTVYDVAVACTCPDFHYRRRICKHMVEVGTYDVKGSTIL